jgi:lysylphosphatidylglycerol synthetase-like protein (DUF2156 family)
MTLTRAFHRIPVLGWMARDISKDIDNIWYALVIALTALVLAFNAWGLVALAMAALALAPVMFVLLILISRG